MNGWRYGNLDTMECYSAIKKKWNNGICSYMDEPRGDIFSKSERERPISYGISYMWNLKKNVTNELIYKTERDSQT